MKNYLAVFIGIALIAGLAVMNLVKAEETNISTPDTATSAQIAPIVQDVASTDLRQSLSITENSGRMICKELRTCPLNEPRNNTEVLIRAAKVTEIGTGTLKILIFGYNYKIDTTGSKLISNSWSQSNIDEFSVGDIVNVWGYLDNSDNYLIHAQTIRNVSIQQKHTVFKGVIESITPPDTFVLKVETSEDKYILMGAKSITVIVDANTKIIKSVPVSCATTAGIEIGCLNIGYKETIGSFNDLQVGMKVVVRGIWNRTLSKIQARVITIGGENDARPFFGKTDLIPPLKPGASSAPGAGQSTDSNSIRNKILELQSKVAEIMAKLKTVTSTSQ